MLNSFYNYLWAVSNWWWIVIGILFGLDQLLEWIWPAYRTSFNKRFRASTRRRVFLWMITGAVFLSGFLAWQEEHNKVEILQDDLRKSSVNMLREELDTTKQQLAEFRERFTLRQIQDEASFIQALTTMRKLPVAVMTEIGNEEAVDFSKILVSALRKGGWEVQEFVSFDVYKGVAFAASTSENADVIDSLRRIFARHGIEVVVDPLSSQGMSAARGVVEVTVGRKP